MAVAGVYAVTSRKPAVAYHDISVSGLSLCVSDCGVYPAPMAEGIVNVNSTAPLSTLGVYVNNTFNGFMIQNPATYRTTGAVGYMYKEGHFPSSIPVVPGDTYVFTFTATFQDGSKATVNETVVAN
jgi:hypothetical protein